MPLEFWIMMMTLFNIFLVVTYLYYKSLHLKTKSKLEQAVEGLEMKISRIENSIINQFSNNQNRNLSYEDDED